LKRVLVELSTSEEINGYPILLPRWSCDGAVRSRRAGRQQKQLVDIDPDCGLKTPQWAEVRPALQNMVAAARQLRVQ